MIQLSKYRVPDISVIVSIILPTIDFYYRNLSNLELVIKNSCPFLVPVGPLLIHKYS